MLFCILPIPPILIPLTAVNGFNALRFLIATKVSDTPNIEPVILSVNVNKALLVAPKAVSSSAKVMFSLPIIKSAKSNLCVPAGISRIKKSPGLI